MKRIYPLIGILLFTVFFTNTSSAQGDVRTATGMPIPIGAAVIWGQVELKGLKPGDSRPAIIVNLLINGVQVDTSQANDKGFYYFLREARDGAVLAVMVGGIEVGRQMISSARGDRYDMAINWDESARQAKPPGVISVKDAYKSRTDSNNKLFDKATSAEKNKNTGEAIKLFNELLKADPQDFVAWTELGSLYFGQSKLSDAEKAYNKALELKPDFMVAMMNMGKLYLVRKEFDKAIGVLEKAVAADQTSADAFHYLGEAYLEARLGSKAVPALNEAIRLAPIEKAEIHLRLAALYNAAGYKNLAAMEYKLFLEKKPDHQEKAKMEKYIKENLN